MEAPDECGHRGEAENKIKAIELIDSLVAGPMLEYLKNYDYRVLVMPDHPTPLCTKTHSGEAVPYLLYDSSKPQKGGKTFTEATCKNSGNYVAFGPEIMNKLLEKM
jgi:2,3-bisphosphoglycerate-independent phosphoglycerate mutase